jgi:NADP-dependent 3-hydroxy acid dehydrogenase YdfG
VSDSRSVLITGCSTGIGRATAERMLGKGWTVYATARKTADIADLKKAGCKTMALDVTKEASMEKAVKSVVDAEGAVYGLVNNAGYSQSGALETLPMESVRRQFDTNVFGLLRMCQLVLPSMRAAGEGRIVNISSIGGKVTFPGGGVYHGTKHAVEGISDVLRWEVADFGVKVAIIEPGLIKTEFGNTAAGSIAETGKHAADGPYGEFNAMVGSTTAGAYDNPMIGVIGGGPDAVAKKISRALSSRRPRTRYKVTPSAHMTIGTGAVLTDRGWDRFLRAQFKRPRPESAGSK